MRVRIGSRTDANRGGAAVVTGRARSSGMRLFIATCTVVLLISAGAGSAAATDQLSEKQARHAASAFALHVAVSDPEIYASRIRGKCKRLGPSKFRCIAEHDREGHIRCRMPLRVTGPEDYDVRAVGKTRCWRSAKAKY